MGGKGSGRKPKNGWRLTTEDLLSLDVRYLNRKGMLEPGKHSRIAWTCGGKAQGAVNLVAEADRIVLAYRHQHFGHDWRSIRWPVWIERTPCHLGGARPWFLCPGPSCGRRVALLYCDEVFLCRHCLDLVYPSQSEPAWERTVRKMNRICEKLGWATGLLNRPGWEKPRGMHWATFAELMQRHDKLRREALDGLRGNWTS